MSTTQSFEITPQVLLRAYSIGMFPMADSAEDPTLFWVDPEERGIFPLDGLIVSRSLAKLVRSDRYEVRVDHDFDAVIEGCAGGGADRPKTWINERIRKLYRDLFHKGFVHTVEAWRDGELVGGLYGVQMGGAFFGESMFHSARDASKVALVHLVARLNFGGFGLLDAQFVNPHLERLGAIAMPRAAYHKVMEPLLERDADFFAFRQDDDPEAVLASALKGQSSG